MVLRAQLDLRDYKANVEKLVIKEKLVIEEIQVKRVQLEFKVLREIEVKPVQLELKVIRVYEEKEVQRVPMVREHLH